MVWCRLPKLRNMHLAINNISPIGLELLLSTMRHQLPDLKGFSVGSTVSWLAAAGSWQQLGVMTQLTRLDIQLPQYDNCLPTSPPWSPDTDSVTKAFQWRDIASLAGLTQLQLLALAGNSACGHHPHSGLGFLGKMTALTDLHLDVPLGHT